MTTMTDPVVTTLQDNALLLMAQHVANPPAAHRPRSQHQAHDAGLDGMAVIACDALHLGLAPFGVKLAVIEAVRVRPHPDRTAAFYTTLRELWKDAIVNDIRAQLNQPRPHGARVVTREAGR